MRSGLIRVDLFVISNLVYYSINYQLSTGSDTGVLVLVLYSELRLCLQFTGGSGIVAPLESKFRNPQVSDSGLIGRKVRMLVHCLRRRRWRGGTERAEEYGGGHPGHYRLLDLHVHVTVHILVGFPTTNEADAVAVVDDCTKEGHGPAGSIGVNRKQRSGE